LKKQALIGDCDQGSLQGDPSKNGFGAIELYFFFPIAL
jgi:hypothetical protein